MKLIKPVQLENTYVPKVKYYSPSSIIIDYKPMHPLNALLPIYVTLFGIFIDYKLVQPENS